MIKLTELEYSVITKAIRTAEEKIQTNFLN